MELMQAYAQVKKRLEQLDFHSFWPGFAPCPFAIYDSEFAVLDGKQMPRPEGFYANTALEHEGRWLPSWFTKCFMPFSTPGGRAGFQKKWKRFLLTVWNRNTLP